jgi:hypothetical protein
MSISNTYTGFNNINNDRENIDINKNIYENFYNCNKSNTSEEIDNYEFKCNMVEFNNVNQLIINRNQPINDKKSNNIFSEIYIIKYIIENYNTYFNRLGDNHPMSIFNLDFMTYYNTKYKTKNRTDEYILEMIIHLKIYFKYIRYIILNWDILNKNNKYNNIYFKISNYYSEIEKIIVFERNNYDKYVQSILNYIYYKNIYNIKNSIYYTSIEKVYDEKNIYLNKDEIMKKIYEYNFNNANKVWLELGIDLKVNINT